MLVRRERTPGHESGLKVGSSLHHLTSITGSVDPGFSLEECVVKELLEESGYAIKPKDLISLGTFFPSKMLDTQGFLFAVEINSQERLDALGDGSEGEVGSFCDWVPLREAVMKSACPSIGCAVARLLFSRIDDKIGDSLIGK